MLTGTVRRILLVLLLAVLIPILVVEVGLSLALLQDWRAQQLQNDLVVARAAATTFRTFVRDVQRQGLTLGLAIAPPEPLPPVEVTQLLSTVAMQYPAVREFSWLSPTGVILASSQPAVVGADIAGRSDVQAVMGGTETFVSDLLPPASAASCLPWSSAASSQPPSTVCRRVHWPSVVAT